MALWLNRAGSHREIDALLAIYDQLDAQIDADIPMKRICTIAEEESATG